MRARSSRSTSQAPLANDDDGDGDELVAKQISEPRPRQPLDGLRGDFEYHPDDGFSGKDLFTYRPFDGVEFGPVTKVTITVARPKPTPTPTPPPTAPPSPTPTPEPTPPPTPSPTPTPPPTPTPTPVRADGPSRRPARPRAGPDGVVRPIHPTEDAGSHDPALRLAADDPDPAGRGDRAARGGPSGHARRSRVRRRGGSRSTATRSTLDAGRARPPSTGSPGRCPMLVLTVPGLLVVLAVGLQILAGAVWIPVIRRRLGGDGLTRPDRRP